MEKLSIRDIHVGNRHRGDLGDIAGLAESIERRGLLHPPVVTTDHELVVGLRRIEAAKRLGWEEIEVRVIDPDDMLQAERDENEVRKDFTPSERVAIGKAIERLVGKRQGARTDKENSNRELRKNFSEVPNRKQDGENQKQKKRTEDMAAEAAGFGNRITYRQAEKVVEAGSPALVEAMDKGEVSIAAAAVVAMLPPAEQAEVVAKGPDAVTAKAVALRKGKSRVNGVLTDDPPDIAKARRNGKLAPDVVPEVDEPGAGAPDAPDPVPGELPDEEWLAALPVRAQLSATRRKVFDADALDYRRSEPARKAFQHAMGRALKSDGEWAYRVRRLLKTDHPKHWLSCVAVADGGCAGTGQVPLIGNCPKCRGRGYYLR